MINRKKFFDTVRGEMFNGKLSADQVNGLELILAEYENRKLNNDKWLSYILATAFHETGGKMISVKEKYSGTSAAVYFNNKYGIEGNAKLAHELGNVNKGDGFKYMGRGLVQITGRSNYKKFGIENNPEAALEKEVAVNILFDGMINGKFTGKSLKDYLIIGMEQPVNARRIINGVDKANLIAGYYWKFKKAING